MHSAEQPADAKRYYRRRIGLGFDGPAKPLVKGSSGLARGVGSLAVEVLGCPRRLVEFSLYLRSGVACQAAHSLFDLAADVSGRARYAVFIHGSDPSVMAHAACFAPLLVSHATLAGRQCSDGFANRLLFAAGREQPRN
jgi:hypothetical protein